MISYDEFRHRRSFDHVEVLAFAHGTLIDDEPAGFACKLPTPPLLMFDRIVDIDADGNRGSIRAERRVRLDDWFFQCHFKGDPVVPGCLNVDAIWQLIGFFCAWRGAIGAGRALGCRALEFDGQIRPHDSLLSYEVDIRRFTRLPDTGTAMAIGAGRVLIDGRTVCTVEGAKVGVFRDIDYPDYPAPGPRSQGDSASMRQT